MPNFVSIHANGNKGPVVTVTEAFAESIGAKVLEKEPAVDATGRPLPAREAGSADKEPPEGFAAPDIADPKTSDASASAKTKTGGSAASKPEEASK